MEFVKATMLFAEVLRQANRKGWDNGGTWKVYIALALLLKGKSSSRLQGLVSILQESFCMWLKKRQFASLSAVQSFPLTCLHLFQSASKL